MEAYCWEWGVYNLIKLTFSFSASLHNHIESQGIEFLQFTFRWMNNLLMRELPLRCTIRLWDTYLVSETEFCHYYLLSLFFVRSFFYMHAFCFHIVYFLATIKHWETSIICPKCLWTNCCMIPFPQHPFAGCMCCRIHETAAHNMPSTIVHN